LVHTGKGEKLLGLPLPVDFPQGTFVHADLAAFAEWLLAQPDVASKHKAGVSA
jgi:D-glycero-D-manno-heptose 1,7-bisphosphate phosphatase